MANYNRICIHKNVLMIENIMKHGFLCSYRNKGRTNRLLKHTQISIIDGIRTSTFTNKSIWYRISLK